MPLTPRKIPGPERTEKPRRQRRKQARPAEIIEAGLVEFSKRGFAAAKMEDVARRAGIAKGTIYLYFADKEALFTAAVRSRVMPVFDEVDGMVERFDGPTEAMLRLLIETLHARVVGSDIQVLIRMIIAEGPSFPELVDLYYRETVAKGRRVLANIVERGISRGDFKDGPIAEVPEVLISPAIMAIIWSLTFNRIAPLDMKALALAHVEMVLSGVLKRQ